MFGYIAVIGLVIAIIGKPFHNLAVILTGGIILITSLISIYGLWVYSQIKKSKVYKEEHNLYSVTDAYNHQALDIQEDYRYYKNIKNLSLKINLSKLKLIICDLDGTLLNHNGFLSVKTIRLLNEFFHKYPNILFVPATGRDFFTTKKALINNLALQYAICNNGSVLTT